MELSRPANAILFPPSLSFHRHPSTQGSKAPGHQVLGHRSLSCELSSVPLTRIVLVDFTSSVAATVAKKLHSCTCSGNFKGGPLKLNILVMTLSLHLLFLLFPLPAPFSFYSINISLPFSTIEATSWLSKTTHALH